MFGTGGKKLELSVDERRASSVLIVEPNCELREQLKESLIRLGFGHVSDTTDHVAGLERFKERNFTHVIFDAQETNMPSLAFLSQVISIDSNVIALPISSLPQRDAIFEMLQVGARAYISSPYTEESLDESLVTATKGEALASNVLNAKERNMGFAALIAVSLDKACTVLRNCTYHARDVEKVPEAMAFFRQSVSLAKVFEKGGYPSLQEAIQKYFVNRAHQPATKLGRVRQKLKAKREAKL